MDTCLCTRLNKSISTLISNFPETIVGENHVHVPTQLYSSLSVNRNLNSAPPVCVISYLVSAEFHCFSDYAGSLQAAGLINIAPGAQRLRVSLCMEADCAEKQ